MSKGRLTRQELGWLLTQEAQGAAERLRRGVTALTQAPPAPDRGDPADPSGVETTLSALDDTMKMLSSLHARPVSVRGRRGRIDLASLLWELAPDANVSIEPGSGTEVFGDEAELRRMIHVMLGHGSGSGTGATIRREGEEVVVGVMLGPDSSATAESERAWLSRMAVRHGGRYGLDGSMEFLTLPAEDIGERDDLAKLRKELDEARKQGEAYARELAAVWAGGDEPMVPSTYPPPVTPSFERLSTMARLAGGVSASLRALLSPLARDLSELRVSGGPRKSSPDLELSARGERGEGEDRLDAVRRRLVPLQELVGELTGLGECDPLDPAREIDLAEIVRAEVRGLEPRARRAGVGVQVRAPQEDASGRVSARVAPRLAGIMVRELVSYAIAATPRASGVIVTLYPPEAPGGTGLGARIVVDDAGPILPAGARRALLALEVEPGTFGRPSSLALFAAAEMAAAQGALLELGDAPAEPTPSGRDVLAGGSDPTGPPSGRGLGGGIRVVVTFPR